MNGLSSRAPRTVGPSRAINDWPEHTAGRHLLSVVQAATNSECRSWKTYIYSVKIQQLDEKHESYNTVLPVAVWTIILQLVNCIYALNHSSDNFAVN